MVDYTTYCKNVTIEILKGLTDDHFSCTGEDFAFVISSRVEQMPEKQVKQVYEAWAKELHEYFEFYVKTYGPVPCNPFNEPDGYVHDCLNFGIRTLVATAPIITELWINDIDIDAVRGELIKHIEDYGVIEFHEI